MQVHHAYEDETTQLDLAWGEKARDYEKQFARAIEVGIKGGQAERVRELFCDEDGGGDQRWRCCGSDLSDYCVALIRTGHLAQELKKDHKEKLEAFHQELQSKRPTKPKPSRDYLQSKKIEVQSSSI